MINSGGKLRTGCAVLLVAVCAAADLFVLRAAWTGSQVAAGEYRRGYFEPFADGVGLAIDGSVRPVSPAAAVTADGRLAVPPGMTAVLPLAAGVTYEFASALAVAPYVVVGGEAALADVDLPHRHEGEARLRDGRTPAISDGRLVLQAWTADRPWRADERRLAKLRETCVGARETAVVSVAASAAGVEFRIGTCALREATPPASGVPLAAVLAGPDWVEIGRVPAWRLERWYLWPVLAAVAVRVAATWWAFGVAAVAAVSAALLAASLVEPVTATMTWPVALAIGVFGALARALWLAARRVPPSLRLAAAAGAAVVVVAAAVGYGSRDAGAAARAYPPIMRVDDDETYPATCAVIGYSTAGGASLRGADMQHGRRGLRWFLNEECPPCRRRTGALFGGGQTLDWARDAYCASPDEFGAGGRVIFFGGANDDFMWGILTLARSFIVSEQGRELWQRSQAPAAAASLRHSDAQEAAIAGLAECAAARGAGLLFLHDFLVTDLTAGRSAERAAMLNRRRQAVEARGGTFIDLEQVFGEEAGVAWFNDFVHPSLFGHRQVAELACGLLR